MTTEPSAFVGHGVRVAVGADHAGFALSRVIGAHLEQLGVHVDYIGAVDETPVDYPAICIEVGERVAFGTATWGVVLGGSGQGEQIAANKVRGIRAALCPTPDYARFAREHNDANVLALGGRFVSPTDAIAVLGAWIGTTFAGGRHARRVDQISAYEGFEW
jgi:ribose 5-phosphate isomerase B